MKIYLTGLIIRFIIAACFMLGTVFLHNNIIFWIFFILGYVAIDYYAEFYALNRNNKYNENIFKNDK